MSSTFWILIWLLVLSGLELVDPGFVSTVTPFPLILVAACVAVFFTQQNTPWKKAERVVLTASAVLTTMVVLVSTVIDAKLGGAALAGAVAGTVGLAFWTLTAPPYAYKPLP